MKNKHRNNGDDESFIHIDSMELEKEWVGQPALYLRYAEKLASAKRQQDEAEAELDLVVAEIDKTVRKHPATYGLDKITESAIKSLIPLQPEYQTALESLHDAKYNTAVLQAAVTALDHRKKALEKLVELFLSGYYSQPRADPKNREQMDLAEKKAARSKAKIG